MIWVPVISEIEKKGYEIKFTPQDTDINFVLSGTYVNPFAVPHKRILICHKQEWGMVWDVVYKDVLKEYYDQVIDITKMSLERLMKKIGGIIEASEPRSSG